LIGPKNGERSLYNKFKLAILNLSDKIEVKPLKLYIAFKKEKANVCDIIVLKKGLKIFINKEKGTLDDSKKMMRDISKTGHWGNGDYEISVNDDSNLEYIMSLIKQAL